MTSAQMMSVIPGPKGRLAGNSLRVVLLFVRAAKASGLELDVRIPKRVEEAP